MSVSDVREIEGALALKPARAEMLTDTAAKTKSMPEPAAGRPRCVELFAGCGGLALGLAKAGFEHICVVELDDLAHATLEANKKQGLEHLAEWPLTHGDVAAVDYSKLSGPVDLVAGGPPCQPFSIGGKHLGPADNRNMWPEVIRAVRELRPTAFLFENVRGLLRPAWSAYLQYLEAALTWPSLVPRGGEDWTAHLVRLRAHAARNGVAKREYRVEIRPINAADYGAPQKRHRAIVMGVRCDATSGWDFPQRTHSRDALLWSQYFGDSYWSDHGLTKPAKDGDKFNGQIERLRNFPAPEELPWVTVRDALRGLPDPIEDAEPVTHHRLRLGAKAYKKHTGSAWDEPAKALKAGDHGVPGGENMLALGDGRVRYFTLREMARLQGFPDSFNFGSGWKRPIKQLGNAVPVSVGLAFGTHLRELLGFEPMTAAGDAK